MNAVLATVGVYFTRDTLNQPLYVGRIGCWIFYPWLITICVVSDVLRATCLLVPVRCACTVLTGGSCHYDFVMKMKPLWVQMHATGNMC